MLTWHVPIDDERVPHVSGGRRAFYTSIDQALSSSSNALLLFAVAQTATVAQFGVVTLLVAVLNTVMGFNRGALGTPILLVSNLTLHQIRIESGYAVTSAALSGIGIGALLAAVGVATGTTTISLAFAIAGPAILIQDVLRLSALACGHPRVAIISDGFWTLVMTALYVGNVLTDTFPIALAALVWGVGGLASGLYIAVAIGVRPRWHRIRDWWTTYAAARVRFGWVQALVPVSTALFILAVTLILGSAVAGGLRGASALFGPIAVLISALPLAFVPHVRLSNKSIAQQWRLLVKTSWVTSTMSILVTLLFVLLPADLGRLLLGGTWDPAVAVIPYVGFEAAANCWIVSVLAIAQTQGMSRASLWLRVLQVILKIGVSVVAAFAFGTAVSVAAGGAIAAALGVAVGLVLARRLVRESSSDDLVSG